MMEKFDFRHVYPAILRPPPALSFSDQFDDRPIGSTTAVIIIILHTVTHLLATNLYFIVIAIRQSWRKWVSLTLQTMFTTGQ